jgi:D-3-phosphoglycerate dehydrogenase
LGVIGCGAIARAVIDRAHAFEMRVACYAPELDDTLANVLDVIRCETVLDVAKTSSIITVHVPKNPATHHLINAEVLNALPANAIVINTSRGGIVDETALMAAVTSKGIRAGLDVFENEPATDESWSCPMAAHDGVYGTHHIGASTAQAQRAVAEAACEAVVEWLTKGEAQNCVNLATTTLAKSRLVVRHFDRVGVLASILEILREADLNVQRMRNQIYSGEHGAACARIHVQGDVSDVIIHRLRSLDAVIDLQKIAL